MRNITKNSKNVSSNFYLPGEEINVSGSDLFSQWNNASSSSYEYVEKKRIKIGIYLCLFAYFVVAFRLFGICIVPNINKSDKVYVQNKKEIIHRANIVDVNENIVATSLPFIDINVNHKNLLYPEATAKELAKVFPDKKFNDIYNTLLNIKNKKINRTVFKGVTPRQHAQVLAIGDPGLEAINVKKRVYPHKNLLSHIVGYAGDDHQGLAGIEKGMEKNITETQIPIRLTINIGIQDTIRGILYSYMKKHRADGAAAILMDVNSGEIISSVSLPDFDPNKFKTKPDNAEKNLATYKVYEPGSVLKIFNTAMALDSGKIRLSESFDATKQLKLKAHTVKDFDPQNRWLSLEETLVHSSNIASARIALKSGFDEQYNFLKKIKFLERLKMEIIETAMPIVPDARTWEKTDSRIATIGYGYGIAVTPMHIIAAYSAMINGGIYYNPTLIKSTSHNKTGIRVISDNTSKQMRKLMRAVVTKGSGRKANVIGYDVGGKTGTADKNSKGKYNRKEVTTTFVAAFPISNPKYALLVMMDNPQRSKETSGFNNAGWNSVPAAAEIIKNIAPQLNVQANYDLDNEINNKIIEASFER